MARINIPPSYRKSTAIRKLSLDTWNNIFFSAGLRESSSAYQSYDEISELLINSESVDEILFDALQNIHNLGSPFGRKIIKQAAEDVGEDLEITDDETDEELVARLWISSREKTELLQVITRANAAFGLCQSSRNYKEYVGDTGFTITEIDKDKLELLVSDWCKENKKSGVVDVFVYRFEDTWCCDIVRGDPIKKVSVIADDHQDVLAYRPAVQDHISIEPETGRIRILSSSLKLTQLYRKAIGEVLLDSPTFFSSENICTLEPLLTKGSHIFSDVHFPEINSVNVTELTWRRGDRDSLLVKGSDCLEIIKRFKCKTRNGETY